MKFALLFGFLLASSCFSATGNLHRNASYSEFLTEAIEARDTLMPSSDACRFSVIENRAGFNISIRTNSGDVSLQVTKEANIVLTGDHEEDGMFEHIFTISGIGSLTITHSLEAFDRVAINSVVTGKTLRCE